MVELGLLVLQDQDRSPFDRGREALKLSEDAISLAQKHEDLEKRANIFFNAGRIKLECGCLDEAISLFSEAESIYEQEGNRYGRAFALEYIGNLKATYYGDMTGGLKRLNEALEYFLQVFPMDAKRIQDQIDRLK